MNTFDFTGIFESFSDDPELDNYQTDIERAEYKTIIQHSEF